MKHAICNELYAKWSDQDAMRHAFDLGYRGWEIAPFTLGATADAIPPARRQAIRQSADDVGMEIIGLHWLLAKTSGFHLTSPDAAVRAATGRYFEHLIELCHEIGGHLMVLGSPDQRNLADGISFEQGIDYAAEILKSLAGRLSDRQITIAIEPLGPEEGNFLLTADDAQQLIEAVGSPQVQLHLDVKAMCTEPDSIPDIIDRHQQHTVHFHANDPNRQGPGMGDVDFYPILQTLKQVDYQGWISVEVFDYSPGVQRLASDSIAYLQRIEKQIHG